MNGPDDVERKDVGQGAGVPPEARKMLRVVYSMGILLVLLFVIFVGALIWKSARRVEPKPFVPAQLGLGLPAGTDIRQAELDGDRLLLNTGREVIVIDLRKNLVLSRISANP